jgi:hypothetical protein
MMIHEYVTQPVDGIDSWISVSYGFGCGGICLHVSLWSLRSGGHRTSYGQVVCMDANRV